MFIYSNFRPNKNTICKKVNKLLGLTGEMCLCSAVKTQILEECCMLLYKLELFCQIYKLK